MEGLSVSLIADRRDTFVREARIVLCRLEVESSNSEIPGMKQL